MCIRRVIFLAAAMVLLAGCRNEQQCDVPSCPVVFDMHIASMYPHFVPDNGFQTLEFREKRFAQDLIGYAGLLVWVDMEGKYNACDLCCPNCLDVKRPVETDGIWAVCPVCGEKYDLSYGFAVPTEGRTRQSLRRYTARYGSGVLHIRN